MLSHDHSFKALSHRAGKGFCFCIFYHLERFRGNTIPSPVGATDRRCAFPEVPLAFGLQNASHHQYAFACGYLQSPALTESADPSQTFMGNALGCSLGPNTLAWIKHSACSTSSYLPVALRQMTLGPGSFTCSHCCNRPKRLPNDLHCMDCTDCSARGLSRPFRRVTTVYTPYRFAYRRVHQQCFGLHREG